MLFNKSRAVSSLAGFFACVGMSLFMACGGATSDNGTTPKPPVGIAPRITVQPQGTSVQEGDRATFSVTATGTNPITYQWKVNGRDINSANASSYRTGTLTQQNEGERYSVSVTNAYGDIISDVAVLHVTAPPEVHTAASITTQPQGQTVNVGQTATFTVVAAGSAPLTYQWKLNGNDIANATSSSYTTPATTATNEGERYSVTVSNPYGAPATSAEAVLHVTVASTGWDPHMMVRVDGAAYWMSVAVDSSASQVSVQWNGTWYNLERQSWDDGGRPVFALPNGQGINFPDGSSLVLKATGSDGSVATTQSFTFRYGTAVTPALASSTPGEPTTPVTPIGPVTIDPNWRTQVNYIGRFDQSDSKGPRFSWSGSAIKARFQGTNISIQIARYSASALSYLNVQIDDRPSVKVEINKDGMFTLATGLSAGEHTIEVSRRDEAWLAELQYQGFAFDQGQLLASPARLERRIEFIGDSITCGYGNEAPGNSSSFSSTTENNYLAYGSVTARLLNAEPMTVAWSGKGVFRNRNNGDTVLVPQLYTRTLATKDAPVWDFSTWIPQVVVINLGTNDFASSNPDRTGFVNAYIAFVKVVRGHYPNAHIYCAVGPMMYGTGLAGAKEYIETGVVGGLRGEGDTKIHFIQFPTQDGSDGYGADWHPSVARHQKMADQLVAAIRTDLGW